MSRIGKQPVEIPSGVKVSISDRTITMESGGKSLTYTHRPEVRVAWDESEKLITVGIEEKDAKNRQVRAYWGLTRAMLQNMVIGVTKGYQKRLQVVGVGWGAAVNGQKLELKLGFASPVIVAIPQGLDVSVERDMVTIKGTNKQLVGQFAADVRSRRKPEPYNGKGIKYDDEVIKRKQGKVFGS
ncbi:MAG: 50S ribosomal protein L6 [Phycisphaeraceae bacterium]|nr:MAG: 50S ribosomal protein L6 [Phycisphaeraceae bacterium]